MLRNAPAHPRSLPYINEGKRNIPLHYGKEDFEEEHRFKQLFHEKLLDVWSVLIELSPDSVEIIIRCPGEGLFNVRIFGETDGRILAEENDRKAMGNGTIPIPFEELKDVYTGGRLDSLGRKLSVRKVRLAIADYLLNQWYKGKGTRILYNVRIDTLDSYFNEFTWEFSHLNKEVLEDGYFEYHRIHIQVQERNDQLELSWQFTGKFGSGILFPPPPPPPKATPASKPPENPPTPPAP